MVEGSKELHNREFIPLHIVHDQGQTDIESLITLIFNGETAGRFPLARNASVKDGLLDCVMLRKCKILEGAWSALKYLASGKTNEDIVHILLCLLRPKIRWQQHFLYLPMLPPIRLLRVLRPLVL